MKTHLRCLQKKYEESQKAIEHQKLKIDVLEAEKLTLQAEKTSFEARLEEVNLKLKLKTAEYDSLLANLEKDDQESTAQSTAHLQSELIVIDDNEPIGMVKSVSKKGPTPKPRKRKATAKSASNSANKENSIGNSNTRLTRSR